MATLSKSKLFNSPKLDSRVKSANTKMGEIWLGYFTGPMLVYMAYYSIAGSYLTQFYTDVLGLAMAVTGTLLYSVPAPPTRYKLSGLLSATTCFLLLHSLSIT